MTTMKICIEIRNSISKTSVFLDGVEKRPCEVSRILTGTQNESNNGIFSSGNITYWRLDGAQKMFSQPEPLETCTPEILKARIAAVNAWVTENDCVHTIEFEV